MTDTPQPRWLVTYKASAPDAPDQTQRFLTIPAPYGGDEYLFLSIATALKQARRQLDELSGGPWKITGIEEEPVTTEGAP